MRDRARQTVRRLPLAKAQTTSPVTFHETISRKRLTFGQICERYIFHVPDLFENVKNFLSDNIFDRKSSLFFTFSPKIFVSKDSYGI